MRRGRDTFAAVLSRLARLGGLEIPAVAWDEAARFDARSVELIWNPRLRSRAGCAKRSPDGPFLPTLSVELNPLLEREGPAAVFETLVHEMAHHLAGFEHGHGPAWRRELRRLGGREGRLHSLPSMLERRAEKRVVGRCEKCGQGIERRRALKRGLIYTHTHTACGGRIRSCRS